MGLNDDYKTPQQALEWATTKVLTLDAENVRLKTLIGQIRVALMLAKNDEAKRLSLYTDLTFLFSRKSDD